MSQENMSQGNMSQENMSQGNMNQGNMNQGNMSQGNMNQGNMNQGNMNQGNMSQANMSQGAEERDKLTIETEKLEKYKRENSKYSENCGMCYGTALKKDREQLSETLKGGWEGEAETLFKTYFCISD